MDENSDDGESLSTNVQGVTEDDAIHSISSNTERRTIVGPNDCIRFELVLGMVPRQWYDATTIDDVEPYIFAWDEGSLNFDD